MLFYRFLNFLVTGTEVYFLNQINSNVGVSGGSPTENFIEIGIFANFIIGAILFLVELFMSKDSSTVKSVKFFHPFFEIPVKLFLLNNLGQTLIWGPQGVSFDILQEVVRIDLTGSYLSYAWVNYWPYIVGGVNTVLLNTNHMIHSVARRIKDSTHGCCKHIEECFYAFKVAVEKYIECCLSALGCGGHDLGKYGNCFTFCGRMILRCIAESFNSIMACIESFFRCLGLNIRTPRCSANFYDLIDDEPAYDLGFIKHIKSGLYVYPETGKGVHLDHLTLGPAVNDPHLVFRLHKNGCVEHDQTEMFVHPEYGQAVANQKLVLHEGGHVKFLFFKFWADGSWEHTFSHLFVHPDFSTTRKFLYLSTLGHHDEIAFKFVPYTPGPDRLCINGHKMHICTKVPEEYSNVLHVECDKCAYLGLGVPEGTPFYHCSKCKYDTCVECAPKGTQRV